LFIHELQEQLACGTKASTPSYCGASTLTTFKEHPYEGALVVGMLRSNGNGHLKRSMEVGATLVKCESL
jgi:hypothetical protein